MKKKKKAYRLKVPLLWFAGARVVIGVIAIPLAKFLYKKHFLILVLMRPTKDVLLAGAILAKSNHTINVVQMALAALPLTVLGVWNFFYLGQAWSSEINSGKMPGFGGRILPKEKVKDLEKVLRKKGVRLIFFGRIAAFPSALVAAAAGSSKMPSRKFLPPDGLGAVIAMVEVVGAGYLLGHAGKAPVTIIGVIVLAGLSIAFGRYLRREA